MIRLYVIEDHPLMRKTLDEYFQHCDDVEVCGMADTATRARDELADADPSVVLLDLSLPDRSGLALLEEIQQTWATPTVILSGHGSRGYVQRAMAAGATGYVLKGSPGEIRIAVRAAAAGRTYLSEAVRGFVEDAEAPARTGSNAAEADANRPIGAVGTKAQGPNGGESPEMSTASGSARRR